MRRVLAILIAAAVIGGQADPLAANHEIVLGLQ